MSEQVSEQVSEVGRGGLTRSIAEASRRRSEREGGLALAAYLARAEAEAATAEAEAAYAPTRGRYGLAASRHAFHAWQACDKAEAALIAERRATAESVNRG